MTNLLPILPYFGIFCFVPGKPTPLAQLFGVLLVLQKGCCPTREPLKGQLYLSYSVRKNCVSCHSVKSVKSQGRDCMCLDHFQSEQAYKIIGKQMAHGFSLWQTNLVLAIEKEKKNSLILNHVKSWAYLFFLIFKQRMLGNFSYLVIYLFSHNSRSIILQVFSF